MSDQETNSQNEIAEFRAAHEAALLSASHPEHGTRVRELFDLTAKRFGSEAISDRGYIRGSTADKSPNTEIPVISAATVNQPLAGEAAGALQAEIVAFRNQHSEALYDSGHAEHERRVNELTELTARLHGDTSANDPVNEFSTKKAAVMEEAMKPLAATEFKIGQLDDFGKALPPYDEWDAETEADARTWMANGEVNAGEARGLMAAFSEYAQHDFSPEFSEANYDKSVSYLRHQYGDEGLSEAIAASNRVVAEIGGQKLKDWLKQTGMGNSPALVYQASRIAERKGYIKRKSAQP